MNKTPVARTIVALAGWGVVAWTAPADVLTFEDLPASPGGTRMPAFYSGLRWGASLTDWHHMTSGSGQTKNFLALSGVSTYFGAPLDGGDFTLESIDVWSRRGLDATGDFFFVLYHDGAVVYNGRVEKGGRQRFSGIAQAFIPAYQGPIDGVALAFDNDDWDHLAMDNIRLTFIPAPSVGAALVAGAATLLRRRR